MNKEKLAKLNALKKAALKKAAGGGRVPTTTGMKLGQVNQALATVFGKMPYINVDNDFISLILKNRAGKECQYNFMEPKFGAGEKIRYFKKANLFLVDLRYLSEPEKIVGEEVKGDEFQRKSNHLERKFKSGIVSKLKAKKCSYHQVIFQLPDQVWSLIDPEVYKIGKHYYAIFAEFPERQEMTPEIRQKLEEMMKENQRLNQEQVDQMKDENSEDDDVPELVAGAPDDFVEEDLLQVSELKSANVDDVGFSLDDIETVKNEAGVSNEEAVKALTAANGDIVDAIMSLVD